MKSVHRLNDSSEESHQNYTVNGSDVENSPGVAFTRTVELHPPESLKGKHVLVVEDDPIILELLQDVLTTAGFRVLIAKNGPDGLQLFREHGSNLFCVILDYGIPGMHATRLLEQFVEIDANVKVILSSGYPQNFIVEDFPLERITGFMAKPYDPQVLVSELQKLSRQ